MMRGAGGLLGAPWGGIFLEVAVYGNQGDSLPYLPRNHMSENVDPHPASQQHSSRNVLLGKQTRPVRGRTPVHFHMPSLFLQGKSVLETYPIVPIEFCGDGVGEVIVRGVG